MKTIHRVLAFSMLCACVSAFGAEKIEGAFGKKLGEVFDPGKAIGLSKLTDGTPMYLFTTTNGFRAFNRYFVLITPTTHRVYGIWGVGSAENTETAKNEQALLMEILQEKYGAKARPGIMDSFGDVNRIEQGSRYIMTKITGFGNVTFDVRYCDSDLERLAEKERLAEEAKKVDKSGL